jgi:competence protein ComEC
MIDLMKRLNINNRIIKVIILQFAITLLLLPLGGFYFNGVSLFSILINLIAIPLFSIVVMPTLLFAAIIAEVLGSPLIVLYIEPSLAYLVDFLLSIKSKQLWLYLPAISWQMLIFITFSMIMGIVFFKSVFITLPIASIYILSIYFEKEPLTIQVFDVGHGLSVMIYKDGQAVLYDLAARYDSFSYFNYVIYPTLKSKDLTLTKTIISHDDNDHSGGKHDLINKGLGNTLISDNDKCDFNQFLLASVRFSSIVQQGSYKSDNNNSCVVKVSTENFSLLLTGDIEIERENELLNYQFDKAIDVMISPHHGSNTSSSAAFIKHTSPSWVIHSVNLNNRWKLPSHHVVERYSQHGTKQLSTQQGAITIKVYADHYEISRYKSKRKYWFITHENA